jgi:YidC/Oxa1 family membrane protein insertase
VCCRRSPAVTGLAPHDLLSASPADALAAAIGYSRPRRVSPGRWSPSFMSAELDNLLRIVLWVALIVLVYFNYRAWENDYARIGAKLAAGTVSEPLSDQPVAGTAAPAARQPMQAGVPVRVRTDVLDIDIDLIGGGLRRADLPRYPRVKGETEPVRLLNQDDATTRFELDSGLTGGAGAVRPTHLARFSSAAQSYEMAAGQQELRVPLLWQDDHGVTVTKTYVFRRGSYQIGLEHRVENHSDTAWAVAPYAQILRDDPKVDGSMFHAETRAFRGPAIYDGDKYRKLNIEKEPDADFQSVTGGWIAALQHHFVAAIVPPADGAYRFTLAARGREYLLAAMGPERTVPPGASAAFPLTLFVGPKLQRQLEAAGPELDRVADFGLLTPIAKPLFWVLAKIHGLVGNWGWSIVIVTMLLKALFYPLSEVTGRSMAKMRALAPRIKKLQEAHKNNREALMHATMGLYKQEKVSPVSGCLPTLMQLPVFAALYWVLLESVEMRQAPFIGWITDLSSRDPLFILPALMAVAMLLQMKLQGTPGVDPLQQKVMMLMPLVLSVTFATLPAGLVLYYVVNTLLSMAQQWNINRRIKLVTA